MVLLPQGRAIWARTQVNDLAMLSTMGKTNFSAT